MPALYASDAKTWQHHRILGRYVGVSEVIPIKEREPKAIKVLMERDTVLGRYVPGSAPPILLGPKMYSCKRTQTPQRYLGRSTGMNQCAL